MQPILPMTELKNNASTSRLGSAQTPMPEPELPDRKVIRIGTRASKLAMWQADMVQAEMAKANPDLTFEVVSMTTTGDNVLDVPLSNFENKGVFTKELDIALVTRQVDVVVHCVKDLPTILPPGIQFAAVMAREHPEDVVVLHPKYKEKYQEYLAQEALAAANAPALPHSLSGDFDLLNSSSTLSNLGANGEEKAGLCPALSFLPSGAIIGTSALRRQATLARYHPTLVCKDIRGNVGTRLAKLDSGEYDAIILARIGLERLGEGPRIDAVLHSDHYLHAVGQASLAVVCREHDDEMKQLFMSTLHDIEAAIACTIERGMLNALQGGCKVPIACTTKCVVIPNNKALQQLASINAYNLLANALREEDLKNNSDQDRDLSKNPIETGMIPSHLYTVSSPRLNEDLKELIIKQNRLIHQDDSDNDDDEEDEYTDDDSIGLQLPTIPGKAREGGIPPLDFPQGGAAAPKKRPQVPLTPRTKAQTWSLLAITRAAVFSMNGQSYVETLVASHFPLYLKSQFLQPAPPKAWSIGFELGYQLDKLGANLILEEIRDEAHEEVQEQK